MTGMEIKIPTRGIELVGELNAPPNASGLVMFAHGSGSSRRSPRNARVASALGARGLATLLFDLLSVEEEEGESADGELRFDADFLGERLVDATDWVRGIPALARMPIGYFGASTGAAAAVIAAARRPELVSAVVSRGGRPDLAQTWLSQVRAPVLFIVGEADHHVLGLNRAARARLTAPSELVVVPGATHLFEEPGALDEVARLAGDWFLLHLAGTPAPERRALGDPTC
jgi:pimeloyl-ACP methyl ester carboxylesterase